MYLAVAAVCIFGLATANVVPAYSDYKDTLAFLDKIDTDVMIEMLRELIDQRVMDEKAEKAADNYNQKYVDDAPRAEGKKIDQSRTDKSIISFIRIYVWQTQSEK